MSQSVAFKMHMVKRTRHNRAATTERANRMSIINGFAGLLFYFWVLNHGGVCSM